ncbi:MAG: DUF192 domain-containing protein [Anaerolineales bacterium]|nr:DUF192 domain-containing protein [Anaerolineales bacterium]
MPQKIIIKNLTTPLHSPALVGHANSFASKLRGLMFRSHLDLNDGLLLAETQDSRLNTAIHMFFVPFDLAVFWINSDLTVVDKVIAKAWKPFYISAAPAKYTLEIHPNRFTDYAIGDKVEIEHV